MALHPQSAPARMELQVQAFDAQGQEVSAHQTHLGAFLHNISMKTASMGSILRKGLLASSLVAAAATAAANTSTPTTPTSPTAGVQLLDTEATSPRPSVNSSNENSAQDAKNSKDDHAVPKIGERELQTYRLMAEASLDPRYRKNLKSLDFMIDPSVRPSAITPQIHMLKDAQTQKVQCTVNLKWLDTVFRFDPHPSDSAQDAPRRMRAREMVVLHEVAHCDFDLAESDPEGSQSHNAIFQGTGLIKAMGDSGVVPAVIVPSIRLLVEERFADAKALLGLASRILNGPNAFAPLALGATSFGTPEQIDTVKAAAHFDDYALDLIDLRTVSTPYSLHNTREVVEVIRTLVLSSLLDQDDPNKISRLQSILRSPSSINSLAYSLALGSTLADLEHEYPGMLLLKKGEYSRSLKRLEATIDAMDTKFAADVKKRHASGAHEVFQLQTLKPGQNEIGQDSPSLSVAPGAAPGPRANAQLSVVEQALKTARESAARLKEAIKRLELAYESRPQDFFPPDLDVRRHSLGTASINSWRRSQDFHRAYRPNLPQADPLRRPVQPASSSEDRLPKMSEALQKSSSLDAVDLLDLPESLDRPHGLETLDSLDLGQDRRGALHEVRTATLERHAAARP